MNFVFELLTIFKELAIVKNVKIVKRAKCHLECTSIVIMLDLAHTI